MKKYEREEEHVQSYNLQTKYSYDKK